MSQTRSGASPRAIASARVSISAKASAYCVSPGVTTHSTGGASSGASNDAREARRELTTRLCIRGRAQARAADEAPTPVQSSRIDFLRQVGRGARGRVVRARRSRATRCVYYAFCADDAQFTLDVTGKLPLLFCGCFESLRTASFALGGMVLTRAGPNRWWAAAGALALIAGAPTSAFGGAWTLPQGTGQLIATLVRLDRIRAALGRQSSRQPKPLRRADLRSIRPDRLAHRFMARRPSNIMRSASRRRTPITASTIQAWA